jgi:hypothetical protein
VQIDVRINKVYAALAKQILCKPSMSEFIEISSFRDMLYSMWMKNMSTASTLEFQKNFVTSLHVGFTAC